MKPMKQWNTEIDKAYHVYQVQEEHEATSQWSTLYNVLFVQYVFLPTKQAEIYLKIRVLIYHLTYICPSLFGLNENIIFEETVIFKL